MKILNFLTIWIIITSAAYADSGYIEPCNVNPYSLFQSSSTEHMYVGCSGGTGNLQLLVIDPYTLTTLKNFSMDGLVHSVIPINNENSLLVLLVDLDGDGRTEDGELRQISFDDGTIENSFAFDSSIPLAMAVDSTETYVYISHGLNFQEVTPTITKISLSTWQVEASTEFGGYSNKLEISNDDSKIYVNNDLLINKSLGIFNTADLSEVDHIYVDFLPYFYEMGYDNRLFLGNPSPQDNEPALVVVDTKTDEYDYFDFHEYGCYGMVADHINGKLYCTVYTLHTHPEFPNLPMLHGPSGLVMEIDLENEYSFRVFNASEEPLSQLLAFPLDDPDYSCRLFSNSPLSGKLFYFDVPIEDTP